MKHAKRLKFKKYKKGLHIRKKHHKIKSFHELRVPSFAGNSLLTNKNGEQNTSSASDMKIIPSDDLMKKYGLPVPLDKKYGSEEETEKTEKSDKPEKVKDEKPVKKGSTKDSERTDAEEAADELERIKRGISRGKVIDSYSVEANEVKVKVTIVDSIDGKFYSLKFPELSEPTKALLDNIKEKLISSIDIKIEMTDTHAIERLNRSLKEKAEAILNQQYRLPAENINLLSGILINEMVGLGNLELLVADPNLEEIVVTSAKEPVRIYHKKHGWLVTNLIIESEKQIENYSSIIARRVGRQITTLTPLLDAHLVTGDRVNSILYPICTKGNTITIRKFAREPWTAIDYINEKTCSAEVFALIWTAMQYELNILFSGGTASGKTTTLNVSSLFMPPYHRIISIEDTRELQLPEHLYWTPLVTRLPNPEGKGAVTMLDLLVNSLRMRPDRIILGEMRRKEEAEVLFEAMHTGHSVYATLHADSASETISRLVNPPLDVPSNLLKAVHLNVVMFRDRRKGVRRVYQVAEFIPDETDKNGVKANILYRYEPTGDSIIKHGASIRVFEELSRHTGLSTTEINRELEEKKKILLDLVKKNVRDMNSVANVVREFYFKYQADVEEKKARESKR